MSIVFDVEEVKDCSIITNRLIYLFVGLEGIPIPYTNPVPVVFEYNGKVYFLIFDRDASRRGEFACFCGEDQITNLPDRDYLLSFVRKLLEKFGLTHEQYEEIFDIVVEDLEREMFGGEFMEEE